MVPRLCAHVSVTCKKYNRTVMLTGQDFFPDRTATEICCLHCQVYFRLSKKSFILFKNVARRTRLFASSATLQPKKLVQLALQLFCCDTVFCCVIGQFVASPSPVICLRSSFHSSKYINKNAISTQRSMAKLRQTLYYDLIARVSLNIECLLFDFVGSKGVTV